jgi:8-oxo-dGTP pyrophosphatase MutT (NUDIX family)
VPKADVGGAKFTWIRTDDPNKFRPCTQCYGIVFNDAGEILLIHEKGKWQLPGGTPEAGESPVETLKRELMEEADVEVADATLLGVQMVDYPNNPNKDQGDLFFQYRFVCRVARLLDQTPDPDAGIIHPRMFVPAAKVTEYVKWGATGNAIFADAIEEFRR